MNNYNINYIILMFYNTYYIDINTNCMLYNILY